eukprot:TRINITY_DN10750_c0_g2_i1.p1 TRINITY_DN10750_c0_g2~~TRINITY_DN10750_c0_g2_i1.p1  ORF type:complete len:182 (+),score=35.61 TRINITY_DN10750_c0_g2_i1:2-547(+)
MIFFFQAEDGIRDRSPSRGLGDVYKRQEYMGTDGIIPSYLQETLIRELLTFCFKQIIESYAKIKKCSPLGRQLMATDFQSIVRQVDGIIRPLPMKENVENYIHAWNLPPEDLANFVMKFKHYSFKTLWPLFATGNHSSFVKKLTKREYERRIEKEYIDTIKQGSIILGTNQSTQHSRLFYQ